MRVRKSRRAVSTCIFTAAVSAVSLIGAQSARATSGSWIASPADGNWTNPADWSTGTAFPGATTGLTNSDIATFNLASSISTINISSPTLNVGSVLFDAAAGPYTIGAFGPSGGSALLLSSNQSGGNGVTLGSTATSFTGTNTVETFNTALVLEPGSATTQGVTYFTNNSTTAGNTLLFAGNISGGTTTATVNTGGNSDTGAANGGAITLNLAGANTGLNTISGNISDGGANGGVQQGGLGIFKNGAGTWYLTGTNTFTGQIDLNQGILNVASLSNYGVASAIGARLASQESTLHAGVGILFSGGTLQYTGSTPQSTNRQIRINTGGATIDASGTVPTATVTFAYNGSNTNLFSTGGARTLVLTGSNTGLNTFNINLSDQATTGLTSLTKNGVGTWVVGGPTNTYSGTTTINSGMLIYPTGASSTFVTTGSNLLVGTTAATPAIMNIAGGTFSSTNATVANTANAYGSIYQSAGTFTDVNQIKLGDATGASAYYSLSGGTTAFGEVDISGPDAGGSSAVIDVTGGTMNVNAWFLVDRNGTGTGIVNLNGGTINYSGSAAQFEMNWGQVAAATGTSVLNIGGGSGGALFNASGATLSLNGAQYEAYAPSTSLGAVNLLTNGTFRVNGISQTAAGGTSLVNFNGGTLQAGSANTAFLTNTGTTVYLYGNGGTINPSGVAITISRPILAPGGEGVTSIPLASGGTGYTGSPAVTLSGGGGVGATAVAHISNGVVTQIIVTNPGTGYTTAPTATLTGGGGTGYSIGTIAIANNASGNLNILDSAGGGTVTLSGQSTYTGITTVGGNAKAVTLSLSAASNTQVIPDTSALIINNLGTVSLTGDNNVGTVASPVPITINAGGTFTETAGTTVHFGQVTLNGGTIASAALSGDGATYGSYNLDGIVTAGGVAATSTISSNGLAASESGGTVFNVSSGSTSGIDLLISGTIINHGGNAGDNGLIKNGTGLLQLSGSNTYTSATTVNAGTLSITGTIANSLITVNSGASLTGQGNGTSGVITPVVTVNPGAAIDFSKDGLTVVGTTTKLTLAGGLNISGGASETFNVNGTGTDLINIGAGSSPAGVLDVIGSSPVTININSIGPIATGTNFYTLMNYGSQLGFNSSSVGTGPAAFALGTRPPGLYTFTLLDNASALQLEVQATTTPATAYWTGRYDSNWSDYNSSGPVTNFSSDPAGLTDAGQLPGASTDVVFTANSSTGAVSTTLGSNFGINSLTFNSNPTSVAINGSNGLTLYANASIGSLNYGVGHGLIVNSGAGNVSIGVTTVYVANSQTWTNNSASPLSISSNVSGTATTGNVTMLSFNGSGSGNTTLSGTVADGISSGQLALSVATTGTGATILSGNNTFTGGVTITSGTLQLGSTGALNANSPNGVVVNGGVLDLHGNNVTISSISGTTPGGVVTDNTVGTGTTTLSVVYNGSTSAVNYESLSDGPNGQKLAFYKTGTGGMSLYSTSNFSGGSLLDGGDFDLYANNALGSGTITLGSFTSSTNNRLRLNNGVTIPNHIIENYINPGVGQGAIQTVNPTDTATLTGEIDINANGITGGDLIGPTTSGVLNVDGPIVVGGTATFVNVRAGILNFAGGGNYAALTDSAAISLGANNGLATNAVVSIGTSQNGSLDLNGYNQTLAGLLQVNNGATVTNSNSTLSTLTINGSTGTAYSGLITGNLNLVKAGAATFTLSTAHTYTGSTVISGGTLLVSGASSYAVAAYNFAPSTTTATTVTNLGSGTGLNATLNGTGGSLSTTGGPIAGTGMLTLNGTGTTLDVNSGIESLNGTGGTWTVSLWVNTAQAGASLFDKTTNGTSWATGNSDFYLGSNNSGGSGAGTLPDAVRYAGGWSVASSSPAVNTSNWHMVTYVDNNGTQTIYTDAAAQTTTAILGGFSTADIGNMVRFGNTTDPGDGPALLNGSLSDINFYTSALTASQITSLYNTNTVANVAQNLLPTGTPVSLTAAGATLDLESVTQTIASLNGVSGSSVILGGGTILTLTNTAGEYDGVISGTGSLNLPNPGTYILGGSNSYTGSTTLGSGATLDVNGTFASTAGITTAGTITFAAANSSSGSILVRALGPLNISSGGLVTIGVSSSHANRTLVVTNGLSIAGATGAWTGTLDLGNSDLIVHAGNSTSLATITNQIAEGYNAGHWNGTGGIISTAAATNSTHLTTLGVIVNDNGGGTALYSTFDGQATSDGDVLVKYTYYGDADLSGIVDGSDYTRIDNGFTLGLTGWYNGDFNYDGVIDGSDYALIDNSYNTQGASLAAEVASATAQIAGSGGSSAVPEPTTLGLLGLGALGLLGRRRRR